MGKEEVGLNDKTIPRIIVQNGRPRLAICLANQNECSLAASLGMDYRLFLLASLRVVGGYITTYWRGRKARNYCTCQAACTELPGAFN
jgi:hypothetical protein